MDKPMTSREVELAVAKWIDTREHLAVPNVSWGLGLHECDILYLSERGYASEVEIKVSKSDFRADAHKRHAHRSPRIKYLWFAFPLTLAELQYEVPEHAGVLLAYRRDYMLGCKVAKEARANTSAQAFTQAEILKMARLGTLRIWVLKRRLLELEGKCYDGDCDYQI